MKNFEDFKYYKNATDTNFAAKKEFFEKLEIEFYEELKDHEKTKKFLDKFYGSNNESFIKSYAAIKTGLIRNLNYHQSQFYKHEIDELNDQKKANFALDLILQKKLFNLQLQWRAGKIELPDVETCFDFFYWGQTIRNCSFIPEITENEVKLMKDYLLGLDDPDQDVLDYTTQLQDYDRIMKKNEDDDREDMPDWYEYYDSMMGTSMLLILPNNKGQQEKFYLDILRKEHKRNNPENTKPAPPADNRPFLYTFGMDTIDYARYVETDPYILELFRYYEFELKLEKIKPDQYRLEEAIEVLNSADRPIHFNPSKIWHEAIILASFQYKNRRVVEAMDLAYSDYLMYRDLGIIGGNEEDKFNIIPFYNEIRFKNREEIKKAKLLNGEDPY